VARRVTEHSEESCWAGNMADFSTEHLHELMQDKSFLCKCIMIIAWNIANTFILICDKMCFMRCATHDDTCITLNIGYDSTIIDILIRYKYYNFSLFSSGVFLLRKIFVTKINKMTGG